jgi:hypothetical protein
VIAEAAARFPDPIRFLSKFGIVFIDDCCAFKIALLAKSLSSSKSRLLSALQREQWDPCPDLLLSIIARLKQLNLDVRTWSARKYPPGSRIRALIRANRNLVAGEPPHDEQASQRVGGTHDVAELTLHLDIFSWTGGDDG